MRGYAGIRYRMRYFASLFGCAKRKEVKFSLGISIYIYYMYHFECLLFLLSDGRKTLPVVHQNRKKWWVLVFPRTQRYYTVRTVRENRYLKKRINLEYWYIPSQ